MHSLRICLVCSSFWLFCKLAVITMTHFLNRVVTQHYMWHTAQQQITGTRTYSKLFKQIENIYTNERFVFFTLILPESLFFNCFVLQFCCLRAPLNYCTRRQKQVNQMCVRIFYIMYLKIYMLLVAERERETGARSSKANEWKVLKSHLYIRPGKFDYV